MLPPWVSVRILTPRSMASKSLRAVVLFLCCCSDLEWVLLRQILQNQKYCYSVPTRLVLGYTAAGYSVLNNAVFATKKGSDVSRHAQVVW